MAKTTTTDSTPTPPEGTPRPPTAADLRAALGLAREVLALAADPNFGGEVRLTPLPPIHPLKRRATELHERAAAVLPQIDAALGGPPGG